MTSASSVRRAARLEAADLGFDVAQRDRQHTALLQFDDAEGAGEFGQRRQRAGPQLEREARGVGQRPAGLILEVGRQFELQFGVLRERLGEAKLSAVFSRLPLFWFGSIGRRTLRA